MKKFIKRCIKRIPTWIKCPILVFINELGRWPFGIVWAHTIRSFAENDGCGTKGKLRAEKAIQKATYNWVNKHYGAIVKKHITDNSIGQRVENGTVWVFWWQGEEKAPVIVKRCIASIRRHAGNHPVQVIDQNNYKDFVSVPSHIEEKRAIGTISLTHFSDYLRMALLAEHGGLWLDATMYVTGNLSFAFREPIFTVRNPGNDKWNISDWKWSVFAIGGNRQNILFSCTRDLLETYWKNNNFLIDYYIFDYMIRLLYDNIETVRNAIDNIPNNNPDLYYYQTHFNKEFNGTAHPISTDLYKLSWKGQYQEHTSNGDLTVYGCWLRETEEFICQR